MLEAIVKILPVFALVLTGFLYAKFKVLGPASSQELNRFVVNFALPVMLLDVMINASWQDSNAIALVWAVTLSCVLVFIAVLIIQLLKKQGLADASIESLCASYPNSVYIGFPLCLIIFGKEILPVVTVVSVVSTCVLFAATLFFIEFEKREEGELVPMILRVTARVLKSPLVGAPVVGASIAFAGIHLPQSVETFIRLGGSAASPCALVALGVFLAESSHYTAAGQRTTTALISGSKLVLHPLATFLIARYVFGLPSQLVYIGTLLSALPTGAGPFMVAQLYGLNLSVTSRTILLTTAIAVISIAVMMYTMSEPGFANL